MKNRIQKLLSLLLVVCMLTAFMPNVISADEKEGATDVATVDENEKSIEQEESNYDNTAKEYVKPIIIEEDLSKRKENEKHFLCDDGSYIAIVYPEPIHELKDGELKDISTTVIETEREIISNNDETQLLFEKASSINNEIVKLIIDNYEISFEHQPYNTPEKDYSFKVSNAIVKNPFNNSNDKTKEIIQNNKTTTELLCAEKEKIFIDIVNNSLNNKEIEALNEQINEHNKTITSSYKADYASVKYSEYFDDNTDLEYTIMKNGFHEDVILNENSDFSGYTIVIKAKGLKAYKHENNQVDFVNDNNLLFSIMPPKMYDSNMVVSNEIEVFIEEVDNKYHVSYCPNSNWINDEERVWPITIDPFVNYNKAIFKNYYEDYFYEGSSGPYYGDYLIVGMGNGNSHSIGWSINSTNSVTIPAHCQVSFLCFNARLYNTTTSIGTIGVYQYLNSANSLDSVSNFNTVNGEKWIEFVIDSDEQFISNWLNGNSSQLSLFLKSESSSSVIYSESFRPNGSLEYIPFIEYWYDFDYCYDFQNGDYIIENLFNGRMLHYTEANNTVNAWSFSNQDYQKWVVTRLPDDTYTFQPKSNQSMYMEMYFGQENAYQPITTNTYNATTSYPFGRFKLINIEGNDIPENTFAIKPLRSNDSVLEVYLGANTTMTFGNGRVFQKEYNMTVDLLSYTGADNQLWVFQADNVEYNTTLETGMYYITSSIDDLYLSYYDEPNFTNTLCALDFDNLDNNPNASLPKNHQQWYVIKNLDNTYSFCSEKKFNNYIELFYGDTTTGTPLTLYDYGNNISSPFIKFRLIEDEVNEGNYIIYPLSSPRKSLTVYLGEYSTEVYHNNTFCKKNKSFISIETNSIGNASSWTFHSISGKRLEMPMNINQKEDPVNNSNLSNYGCAVCSAADVIAYYSPNHIASVEEDVPYNGNYFIQWWRLEQYNYTELSVDESKAYTYLDLNEPVIMDCITVPGDDHFVVAYKYTVDYYNDGNDTVLIRTYYVLDPAGQSFQVYGEVRTLAEAISHSNKNHVANIGILTPRSN